jgi:hypothetical protein
MPKVWTYGQSKSPHTWQDTADILRSIQKSKKKPNLLMERLDDLEKLLKKERSQK